jgi:hypothetical protein
MEFRTAYNTGKAPVLNELPSVFRLPTQRHYAANCCSC